MSDPNAVVLLMEGSARPDGRACEPFSGAGVAARIRVVKDAGDAIAYLQGQGSYADRESFPVPGLILLSLEGTEKSGWGFLRWLNQQTSLKGIPLVALVDSNESMTVRRAYEMGVHSCLLKPLSANELERMITLL